MPVAPLVPAWKVSRAVPTGRSVVCQVMLLTQRVSNLDREDSMSVAAMAVVHESASAALLTDSGPLERFLGVTAR